MAYLLMLVGGLAATGILTLIFRRILTRYKPRGMWRYGAHGFSVVTAVLLGGWLGVGSQEPMTVAALWFATILYLPAQLILLGLEAVAPRFVGLGDGGQNAK
jgi:hypothetical protein